MMIQQMLAHKTNPMFGVAMTAMAPGAGVANLAGPPSKVLVLSGAVTAEDLKDDGDYKDLVEDMTLEAEKHGTVTSVNIPRPAADGSHVPGVGKVFLVFDFEEAAGRALKSMNGRKFGEEVVTCSYLDEEKYNSGTFTT